MHQKKVAETSFLTRLSLPFRRFIKKRQSLTRRERRNQNGLIIFCIACVFILSSFIMLVWYNMYLIKDLNKQQHALEQEQTQLLAKETNLKRDVKQLKDDDYILKLARQRFLYSKDGELVFSISDGEDEDPNDALVNDIGTSAENEMIGAEKDNPRSALNSSSKPMP